MQEEKKTISFFLRFFFKKVKSRRKRFSDGQTTYPWNQRRLDQPNLMCLTLIWIPFKKKKKKKTNLEDNPADHLLQAVHGGFLFVIINANVEWLLLQGDASEILYPSGLSSREQHRLSPLCARWWRTVSETCSWTVVVQTSKQRPPCGRISTMQPSK